MPKLFLTKCWLWLIHMMSSSKFLLNQAHLCNIVWGVNEAWATSILPLFPSWLNDQKMWSGWEHSMWKYLSRSTAFSSPDKSAGCEGAVCLVLDTQALNNANNVRTKTKGCSSTTIKSQWEGLVFWMRERQQNKWSKKLSCWSRCLCYWHHCGSLCRKGSQRPVLLLVKFGSTWKVNLVTSAPSSTMISLLFMPGCSAKSRDWVKCGGL